MDDFKSTLTLSRLSLVSLCLSLCLGVSRCLCGSLCFCLLLYLPVCVSVCLSVSFSYFQTRLGRFHIHHDFQYSIVHSLSVIEFTIALFTFYPTCAAHELLYTCV